MVPYSLLLLLSLLLFLPLTILSLSLPQIVTITTCFHVRHLLINRRQESVTVVPPLISGIRQPVMFNCSGSAAYLAFDAGVQSLEVTLYHP
jgi:hypothetical protein